MELPAKHSSAGASHAGRTLVIHAGADWYTAIRHGKVSFFQRLAETLAGRGGAMRLVRAGDETSRLLASQELIHLWVGARPVDGPGVGRNWFAGPTHVPGFWQLDQEGIGPRASIRRETFDPAGIANEPAEYFFNGVSGYMLRENVSNLPQPARQQEPLAPAAAAIFLQPERHDRAARRFLDTESMIRAALELREGLPVYVKPHPLATPRETRRVLAPWLGADGLTVTEEASVHDLAAAARIVLTGNSSAGFEALMQKKPVITCGLADYRHGALTPRNERDLADAIRYGPQMLHDFPFEKFFYWFLGLNALEPQHPDFGRRLWDRLTGLS